MTKGRDNLTSPNARLVPVSLGQRRLWALQQHRLDDPAYNVFKALRFRTALDLQALQAALQRVVNDHASLRMRFESRLGDVVGVIEPLVLAQIERIDVGAQPESELCELNIEAVAVEFGRRSFALSRGPLFRFAVIDLAAREQVLLICLHHIIVDGVSLAVLLEEVAAHYSTYVSGATPVSAARSYDIEDYIAEALERSRRPAYQDSVAYWERQLTGLSWSRLRGDFAHVPDLAAVGRTERYIFRSVVAQLAAASRSLALTRYQLLMSAFVSFVAMMTGQGDVALATVFSNRRHRGHEKLIGFIANTVVLRQPVAWTDSIRTFARRCASTLNDAARHAEVSLASLIPRMPELAADPPGLFFSLQNNPLPALSLGNANFEVVEIDLGVAKFPLSVYVAESGDDLQVWLEYDTALYRHETASSFIGSYVRWLEVICSVHDSDLPLALHIGRLHSPRLGTRAFASNPRIHQLSERLIRRRLVAEDLPALSCEGREYTFETFLRDVRFVSSEISRMGARAGDRVALIGHRSYQQICTLWACLLRGWTYVPIAEDVPAGKQALILDDCRPHLIFADDTGRVPEKYRQVVRAYPGRNERWSGEDVTTASHSHPLAGTLPAYLAYTSGSTGTPKGVVVTRANLLAFLAAMDELVAFQPGDRWLAVSSVGFDIAVVELIWALATGFHCIIVDVKQLYEPAQRQPPRQLGNGKRPALSLMLDAQTSPSLLQRMAQAAGTAVAPDLWIANCAGAGRADIDIALTAVRWSNPWSNAKVRAIVSAPLQAVRQLAADWRMVCKDCPTLSVALAMGDGMLCTEPLYVAQRKVKLFAASGAPALAAVLLGDHPEGFRFAAAHRLGVIAHWREDGVQRLENNIATYRQTWRGCHGDEREAHVSVIASTETIERQLHALGTIGVDEVVCALDSGSSEAGVVQAVDTVLGLRSCAARASSPGTGRIPLATHLQCTPSLARILFKAPQFADTAASLRVCMIGGEALTVDLARDVAACTDARIVNVYGPTEATVWASSFDVPRNPERVTLGAALPGVALYVLDEYLQPCMKGVAGELFIGGVGVAQAYWRKPRQTAAAFLPDSFANDGSRMYRTGDRARVNYAGEIEFLGRADRQTKISGHRVELEGIGLLLSKHPLLSDAVATLIQADDHDRPLLVAFVVLNETAADNWEPQLRAYLANYIELACMPREFVAMPRIPLTASDKCDFVALRAAFLERRELAIVGSQRRIVANEAQQWHVLREIWTRHVGATCTSGQGFFELGGNSISAARLVAECNQAFGVELTIQDFYRNATLDTHHAAIMAACPGGVAEGPASLAAQRGNLPRRVNRVSYAQRAMLMLAQMTPNLPGAHHVHLLLRLDASINIPVLRRAFAQLVDRHEILRTAYVFEEGEYWQRLVDGPAAEVEVVEMSTALGNIEAAMQTRISLFIERSFDLAAGEVIRALLLNGKSGEPAVLCLVAHHVAVDGWSLALIVRELAQDYSHLHDGLMQPVERPQCQYLDYTDWQTRYLASNVRELQEFWRSYGAGIAPTHLKYSKREGAVAAAARSHIYIGLDEGTSVRVERRARELNVTLFALLSSATFLVLERECQQADVCFSTDTANRPAPSFEGTVGMMANQVILRAQVPRECPTAEFVRRQHENIATVLSRGSLPYELFSHLLDHRRHADHRPVFDIKLVLNDVAVAGRQMLSFTVEELSIPQHYAGHGLLINLYRAGSSLRGHVKFDAARFDEPYVAGLWDRLQIYLECICAQQTLSAAREAAGVSIEHRLRKDQDELRLRTQALLLNSQRMA